MQINGYTCANMLFNGSQLELCKDIPDRGNGGSWGLPKGAILQMPCFT